MDNVRYQVKIPRSSLTESYILKVFTNEVLIREHYRFLAASYRVSFAKFSSIPKVLLADQ